jgi:hypothetical protein
MGPGAVLASDDVDASFAFATFCERHGLRAEFIFDGRKFFGATCWTPLSGMVPAQSRE